MARLTTARRKALPKSDYGLPGKAKKGPQGGAPTGAYPMPDKTHAKVAKAYASKEEAAGKLSAGAEQKIDAKANKVLGKGRKAGAKPKAASAKPAARPRGQGDGLRAYAKELNGRMR